VTNPRDKAVQDANMAVMQASHMMNEMTTELLILRRALSKVPDSDALKAKAEAGLKSEWVLPLPGLPGGTA
jgi:hypothetical protein